MYKFFKEVIGIIIDYIKNTNIVEDDVKDLKDIYGNKVIVEDINNFRKLRKRTVFAKWFLIKIIECIFIVPLVACFVDIGNLSFWMETALTFVALNAVEDIF